MASVIMPIYLTDLIPTLHQSLGILHKQDIQAISRLYPTSSTIQLGDDCAAIPDGDGYLLLAAEGLLPQFVEDDPWFAGWCAVMVNLSDIAAMGGRAIAIVDTLWSQSIVASQNLIAGMQAAAQAYDVPIVGGHTNCHSPYNALSVAIMGRAQALISGFQARVGDRLLMVVNLQGKLHPQYPFWNAATTADPIHLRRHLALLPELAIAGLCDAGKDISMGGIVGTTLMLLETSHCGAVLDLNAIPRPTDVPLERWLTCFPSYGFLLSVRPECVTTVQDQFHQQDLVCAVVGEVQPGHQLHLKWQDDTALFWDLQTSPLTGFGGNP